VAVLPGNPFESRAFSLGFGTGASVRWIGEFNYAVSVANPNKEVALNAVKQAMDEVLSRVEKRRALNPDYGRATVTATPHATPTGAEAIVSIEGLSWDAESRKQTTRQIEELEKAIGDRETLRKVLLQGALIKPDAPSGEVEQILRETLSSLRTAQIKSSQLLVTVTSGDQALLFRLLTAVPKQQVSLVRKIPYEDLDFVPADMRADWYIFNCCRSERIEPPK
jgi:hypothetical protein